MLLLAKHTVTHGAEHHLQSADGMTRLHHHLLWSKLNGRGRRGARTTKEASESETVTSYHAHHPRQMAYLLGWKNGTGNMMQLALTNTTTDKVAHSCACSEF